MAIESIRRVRCDRCKKFGELDTRTGSCHIEWGRMNNMGKVVVETHVDLCERCTEAFELFLEGYSDVRTADEDDTAQSTPLSSEDLG